MSQSRYRLRPVSRFERAMVYEWRNDPSVRRVMSNPHIVDQEVHKDWWPTAIDDPRRRMLMLDDGEVPAVFIQFFELKPGVSATWGFYAAPRRRSAANALRWVTAQVAAVVYAFQHLRLDILYAEISATNRTVLLLHDRMGFKDAGQTPAGLLQKTLTRSRFEDRRRGPMFARLKNVSIQADPRDIHVPATTPNRPAEGVGNPKRAIILGSANWELAARDFAQTYRHAVGVGLEVTAPPFSQCVSDLADASSALRRNPPDILIFAERFEDLAGAQGEAACIDEKAAHSNFRAYLELIRSARAMMPGRFLINNFAPVRPRPRSIAEALEGQDDAARLAACFNRELLQLAGMAHTRLVPLADQVTEAGRRNSDPGKYWFTEGIPFGQALVDRWTSCVAGIIAAGDGRTVRALVCDVDNTWSGDCFSAVQRCLKMFCDRGVLLVICGDDEDPEILKDSVFCARRMNRDSNPEKISSIARELGLALNSVMVLDNDPAARAGIREVLPHVITPELPWDVAEWPRFLANHPLLTK